MVTKLVRGLDNRIRVIIYVIIVIVMNFIIRLIDNKMIEAIGNYETACINCEITSISNSEDFCYIKVQLENGKEIKIDIDETDVKEYKVGNKIDVYTDNEYYSLDKFEIATIHNGAIKYWNIKVIVILVTAFIIYDFFRWYSINMCTDYSINVYK